MSIVFWSSPGQAQSCSVSFSSIAFGSIDVLSNLQVDVPGSMTASCTGMGGSTNVRMCIAIGNGTYPLSGGLRQMGAGANRLTFQIYQDAAATTVWDTSASGMMVVDLTKQAPSITLPVYGRVPGGQQIVPVGSYSTAMNSVVYAGSYFKNNTPPACGSLGVLSTPTFLVNATVVASCTATAGNMNFGTISSFATNHTATSTITVTCSNGAPYQIRLDGGSTGNINNRRMSLGVNQISYGLYRDAARTLNWGQTDSVDTVAGTGTASVNAHTVYGLIPPQSPVALGTYSDTVIMVVSY